MLCLLYSSSNVNPIELVPPGLQAPGATNPGGVPAGLQRVIPGNGFKRTYEYYFTEAKLF